MKKQVTELVMNVTNESYDAICRCEGVSVRNVSRKFYADICQRVAESVMITGGNESVVERTMAVIDAYISKGIEPDEETESAGILIIFHILKAEIDRAITRSQLARQRALTRRNSHDSTNSIIKTTSDMPQTKYKTPQTTSATFQTTHVNKEGSITTDASLNKAPALISEPPAAPTPSLTARERSKIVRSQQRLLHKIGKNQDIFNVGESFLTVKFRILSAPGVGSYGDKL